MSKKLILAKEGGNSFEPLAPLKLHGRRLTPEEKMKPHVIGIAGTGFFIPGTEHTPGKGEEAYELPRYGSEPGMSRKTIAVHRHGEEPFVIKIERHPDSWHEEDYVKEVQDQHRRINQLLPECSAKYLSVIRIKGVHWIKEGNNRDLWALKSKWVGDKNLAEISFTKESELIDTIGGAVRIAAKLFANNIIYDDMKPEDFCPGKKPEAPILVDEENAYSVVRPNNDDHDRMGEGLASFTAMMLDRHKNKLTPETLRKVNGLVRKVVLQELGHKGSSERILVRFYDELAKKHQQYTGQPTLFTFGKKK